MPAKTQPLLFLRQNLRRGGGIVLLLAFCLALAPRARAQEPELHFEHITGEDGLSSSSVRAILQDHRGFVWIGTQSGLNKYDGIAFTVYQNIPADPNSLSSDNVRALLEDQQGDLWIGTLDGGLNHFDPTTETFTRYQHDPADPTSLSYNVVGALGEDHTGTLWVGTIGGGLNRFDRASQTFTRYQHNPADPTSLSHNDVWSLYVDHQGVLWVGTSGGGLNRFDPASDSFVRYQHDPADPTSLSSDYVVPIYETRDHTLWVGTNDGTLHRFDRQREAFVRYHRQDTPERSSPWQNAFRVIYEDRHENLWVGTEGDGLYRFDREHEVFLPYRNDADDPQSLGNNFVWAMEETEDGLLWVGTVGGISKLNLQGRRFEHYYHLTHNPNSLSHNQVTSLYEDHLGYLWIGTFGGGLNRLDRQKKTFVHYRHDPANPPSISADMIATISEDSRGTLWIGTYGNGLNCFDRENDRFIRYQHDPANPRSLSNNVVVSVHEDHTGALWVGTRGGGVNRFDREQGTFTAYKNDPLDPTSLSSDYIWSIYEDSRQNLWVATWEGGLNRFDRDSETFEHYEYDVNDPHSLGHNNVYSLYEDSQQRLWVCTYGGLNRFDRDRGTFTRYTKQDGLVSNIVYGALEDGEGYLWLSTIRGLSRFDPRTETFRNYDVRDGLQGNEFLFGAFHKNRAGEMFFGGINGFNAFHPDHIFDNPYVPPVYLTNFLLLNKPVKIGGDSPLERHISETTDLILSYEDTVLTFEFAALSYIHPKKNRYRYQLEGFDQEWTEVDSTRNFATYTNLDAGTYVFRVVASNNDDVWNEQGASVRITVTPPWWGTWWFTTGWVVLLLLTGWSGVRFKMNEQTQKLERQRRELEHEQMLLEQQQRLDRVQRELAIAREIQQSLLPPAHPEWDRLDVVCYNQPAREVGGDFYQYHAFHPHRFAFAIGDVLGKGIPAALFMATSLSQFDASFAQAFLPGERLAYLDKSLMSYTWPRRQNCGMCYIELELAPDGSPALIHMVNAGGTAPFIRRREGTIDWPEVGGIPLGMGYGARTGYQGKTLEISDGDMVILTSDGMVEATNRHREMFGFGRLEQAIRSGPQDSATTMLQHLRAAFEAFVGTAEVHDDVTVVVVRVDLPRKA
ncbi:MAG: SpoIIE family protein phosphatase [Chloroflexaceae bacterium]|nr:SpoIIE family protein phosphatase [Chloroflexaceae bacterium]